MSSDTCASGREVAVVLVARPGIAIRLLDGTLEELASGSHRLETRCRPGLYMAEWRSAGHISETMIRVDGSRERETIEYADHEAGATIDPAVEERIRIAVEIEQALRDQTPGRDASVLIVVSSPDPATARTSLEIQLIGSEDSPVDEDPDTGTHLRSATGRSLLAFRVKPGRHHVRFRNVMGERVGMTVPTLPGRRTLVLLTVARAQLLVADGERFDQVEGAGVEASNTVMVTFRGNEDDTRLRERMRIASLLLYDLATGTTSLSEDLVRELEDRRADPVLKLYAALVVLSRLERKLSPDPWTSIEAGMPEEDQVRWLRQVKRWLPRPAARGFPADGSAAWWELRRQREGLRMDRDPDILSRLTSPPMFECAWRWAIEESVDRPAAVRDTAEISAAGRSSGGTAPWLCWKVSSGKAGSKAVGKAATDLRHLVQRVAEQAQALANRTSWTDSVLEVLGATSAASQAAALKAVQLSKSKGASSSGRAVTELALELGLTANQLRRRLVKTSAELAATEAHPPIRISGSSAERSDLRRAPGLLRRIGHPDDPQKGRFGGEALRGEYKLSASFATTTSKNWAKITLVVLGPSDDQGTVEFHLHDSFRPAIEKVDFEQGKARLELTSSGGFTVGAWLPSRGIELELDLSLLEDAPRIVRER